AAPKLLVDHHRHAPREVGREESDHGLHGAAKEDPDTVAPREPRVLERGGQAQGSLEEIAIGDTARTIDDSHPLGGGRASMANQEVRNGIHPSLREPATVSRRSRSTIRLPVSSGTRPRDEWRGGSPGPSSEP